MLIQFFVYRVLLQKWKNKMKLLNVFKVWSILHVIEDYMTIFASYTDNTKTMLVKSAVQCRKIFCSYSQQCLANTHYCPLLLAMTWETWQKTWFP